MPEVLHVATCTQVVEAVCGESCQDNPKTPHADKMHGSGYSKDMCYLGCCSQLQQSGNHAACWEQPHLQHSAVPFRTIPAHLMSTNAMSVQQHTADGA